VFALLFSLLCAPAQDADEGPTPAEIETAVAEVRVALADEDPAVRAEVLTRQRVAAREVIDLVARGLDDRVGEVRQAALESLRWTEHERAVEVLLRTARRDKKLRRHETLGPLLYKAIGQHGDPSSIDVLEDKLLADPVEANVRTRLLALGRVRDPESIGVLLDVARSARPEILTRHRDELRTALMMLTGVDRGLVFERWHEWWRENEKGFEMAEEPPVLRRDEQRRWEDFWGLEHTMERRDRREDRGSDEP
jgi:hypothetical protein